MAYQDTAPVRRRRPSDAPAPTRRRRRRRRRRNPVRFDLIFLAAIVLVVLLVLLIPRQQVDTPDLTNEITTEPVTETTEPTEPPTTEPPTTAYVREPLIFTAADAELIYTRTSVFSEGKAEIEKGLLEVLDWDLTDPSFTVLIIHSHVSESYTKTDGEEYTYKGGDPYRTDDAQYNMVAVGEVLARILEENGIHVIHDTTSFEKPNSDYAYGNAREYLQDLLAENPQIGLILDLHRDAVTNEDGSQWAPTITVDGKVCAKISMAMGFPDEYSSQWYENLSFAVKLGAQMNRGKDKTLFRQLFVTTTSYNFNQYLGPVSMLIEVGTAGNTLEEALNAAEQLAYAIVDLSVGANIP